MKSNESRVTEWMKASRSNGDGACVEMRRNGKNIEVRDSKQHGTGPVLSFTPKEIAAWLDGATKKEFDGLL